MPEPISRRTMVVASAWAVPALALAVATPAAATSTLSTMKAVLTTTGLGAGGYDFNLRDGKVLNSATTTNTNRSNTTVVVVVFTIVDAVTNAPVPGAIFAIDGGNLTDGEGNYVIGIVTDSTSANLPESSTKRTVSGITDANGQFRVKIATATWSKNSCPVGYVGPLIPPSGAITVTMSATGFTPTFTVFPALVNDDSTPVTCP